MPNEAKHEGQSRDFIKSLLNIQINFVLATAVMLFLVAVISISTLNIHKDIGYNFTLGKLFSRVETKNRVLGRLTREPVCFKFICLNYELFEYNEAEENWSARIDYIFQKNLRYGSLRVNGQKFAYDIRVSGSTYTGYNLDSNTEYIFKFYSGTLGRGKILGTLKFTTPADPLPLVLENNEDDKNDNTENSAVVSPSQPTVSRITNSLTPDKSVFQNRGTVTGELGVQYAPPGVSGQVASKSAVIRYRDSLDSVRNFDLYVSPAGAIWKIIRYESNGTSQYVGGFNYDECGDGAVTATDRVIMPTIGLHPNSGKVGDSPNMMVKTNYGCKNSHFSNPWPLDNYQGAGSGRGILPDILEGPVWDNSTGSLYVKTLPKPWVHYNGILDKNTKSLKKTSGSIIKILTWCRRKFKNR